MPLKHAHVFHISADALKLISRDVRLGFGAFVDKAVMPFAGTRRSSVLNPCFPANDCAPMYGFENGLSLTSNTSIFGDRVRLLPISGNQDGPEGGFDALLQAMVCNVCFNIPQYALYIYVCILVYLLKCVN